MIILQYGHTKDDNDQFIYSDTKYSFENAQIDMLHDSEVNNGFNTYTFDYIEPADTSLFLVDLDLSLDSWLSGKQVVDKILEGSDVRGAG